MTQAKMWGSFLGDAVAFFWRAFRERGSFSLRSQAIGPLDFDGARRENVLREAGYAWIPDLWSFFKLLEVGFLPTWVLFLLLSVLPMFRLFEAVRGRLIGPKTWDRIYKIFGRKKWSSCGCSTTDLV